MGSKKTGILTFHAAHNFGSSLQVYALQRTVEKLGCRCEVIDFRTARQRRFYSPLTMKRLLYAIRFDKRYLINLPARLMTYYKFKSFINNRLNLGNKRFKSLEELRNAEFDYEYFISGSDQIWNFTPVDADDAYFLPFVKRGKKIAYAPSFGSRYKPIDANRRYVAEYLRQYDSISVRDDCSSRIVKEATCQDVPILVDPSLLLTAGEWDSILPSVKKKDGYIFYYSIAGRERNKEMIEVANKISHKLGLTVVLAVCAYGDKEVFLDHQGHRFRLVSGPEDFINLIKNASFVLTSSFHGLVFSVLYGKPFLAFNGDVDERLKTFLSQTGLTERSVSKQDIDGKLDKMFDIRFDRAHAVIEDKRQEALEFLRQSLDLNGGILP